MTINELQTMSDRELDELAACKVMEWKRLEDKWCAKIPHEIFTDYAEVTDYFKWSPTGDMNDAFMLVKCLHDDCFGFALINIDEEWSAWFIEPDSTQPHKEEGRILCKEATRAITIAAILAKGA